MSGWMSELCKPIFKTNQKILGLLFMLSHLRSREYKEETSQKEIQKENWKEGEFSLLSSFLFFYLFSFLIFFTFFQLITLKHSPNLYLTSWKYNLYYMLLHQEFGIYDNITGNKLPCSILRVDIYNFYNTSYSVEEW